MLESGGTHPALRPWSSPDALEEPRRGLVSSLETLLQLKVRTGSILTSFAQGYASGGSRLHARRRARHAIRRQDMLCVPRAAVARSSPWRAREQPESRDRRKILSFESERKSSTFLNHMHSIHKCLQIFSSQAQGERGRAQAWRRARHRCARYAQHVVPSARARGARCIHSLDPPEG